jgi:hypothetical protein
MYSQANIMAKPHWTMNIHLKNKGQECKQVLLGSGLFVGGGGGIERLKDDEYGQCSLYTCMKTDQWNLNNFTYGGGRGWWG